MSDGNDDLQLAARRRAAQEPAKTGTTNGDGRPGGAPLPTNGDGRLGGSLALPELYPGFEAEKKAAEERARRAGAASAVPLPGPLGAAFAGAPRRVRGLELRAVVASDLVVLQQINSPLLQVARIMIELKGEPEERVQTAIRERVERRAGESELESSARLNAETAETVLVFTRKPAEVRALLRRGREAFREAAMELLDGLSPLALGELQAAIGEHFAQSFATAVEYEAERADDGTFTSPPAEGTTGSAGG